jgi:CheY-like chemotaxis protein
MMGRRRDQKLVLHVPERAAQFGEYVSVPASFRILHVDDDPLTRDDVERSLDLDPAFILLSFDNARDALAAALDWEPDLIVCGTTLLAELRADPATAKVPALVLSPQPVDIDALQASGAVAVAVAPIDPEKFAATARRHLVSIKLNRAGYDFSQRLRREAGVLAAFRLRLAGADAPAELETLVHKLAGAAGIFNFGAVSSQASALETAIIEMRAGRGAAEAVAANLDALLDCIAAAA